MFLILIGMVVIVGIVGYFFEKMSFIYNGILFLIIICVGGVFLFYFVSLMFGIFFGVSGINVIIVFVGVLIIILIYW